MSKNQEKYNRRMNRDSYFPPLHGASSYNEYNALQDYFDAMPDNWQKSEFSKSIQPSISKANVRLETADRPKQYFEDIEDETIFDKIFNKDTIQAAVGNVAGNAVNAGFNALLQENQFENQKDLQNNAARLNAEAVRMQPQLQVEGMRNAGLNPAQVNGTGAPSLQAGAAAGANSTMGNIFMGIADMIAAAKAPSEIEEILARTALEKEETEDVKPAEAENLRTGTELLGKQIQDAQNQLDMFKSYNEFFKKYAPMYFEDMIIKYQKTGTWNKIGERSRETLTGLADGSIPIDAGSFKALTEDTQFQALANDTDKKFIGNAVEITKSAKQLKDPKITDEMAKEPVTEAQRKRAETALMGAQKVNTSINTKKTIGEDWDLMNNSKEAQEILREDSPDTTKNNVDEAKDRRRNTVILEKASNFGETVIRGLELYFLGRATGGAAGRAARGTPKEIVKNPPNEKIGNWIQGKDVLTTKSIQQNPTKFGIPRGKSHGISRGKGKKR